MATAMTGGLQAQQLEFSKVKSFEHQLDDVMELIDTVELKNKLREVEVQFQQAPTEINKARIGIIYHEVTLNLSFLSKTGYKGYAKKSFDQLSALYSSPSTPEELMPFVASYRASALSLVSAETGKIKLLREAFTLFADAVAKYSDVCYLPEFLRGSVAENLPWIFYKKRKFAKQDFQSIITRQAQNTDYANWKIMSFTYWAWAKQHQEKKYRDQTMEYLDRAIALDPNSKAGRSRAEQLRSKLSR